MVTPAADRLVHVDVAVSNLDIKSTRRVGADPRFIVDWRAARPEIGQRHEIAGLTLLAFR